jgi:hypothetical protein
MTIKGDEEDQDEDTDENNGYYAVWWATFFALVIVFCASTFSASAISRLGRQKRPAHCCPIPFHGQTVSCKKPMVASLHLQ